MNNDLELSKSMFNLKDSLFSKVTKLNWIRYVGYLSFLHTKINKITNFDTT